MELNTIAAIAQILGVVWVLFFGSKTVKDVVQGIRGGRPFRVRVQLLRDIALVVLGVLVLTSLFLYTHLPPTSSSSQPPSRSPGISGPSSPTVQTQETSTPQLALTITPTPTLTPIPTRSLSFNRILTCSTGCNSIRPPFQITITNIVIDPENNQMTLNVTLQSKFDAGDTWFNHFDLQAISGESYQPSESSGSIHDGSGSSIGAVGIQTLALNATYSFVPQSGSTYTLNVEAFCINCSVFIDYQAEQFTF